MTLTARAIQDATLRHPLVEGKTREDIIRIFQFWYTGEVVLLSTVAERPVQGDAALVNPRCSEIKRALRRSWAR